MLKLDIACGIVATRTPQRRDDSLIFYDQKEKSLTMI